MTCSLWSGALTRCEVNARSHGGTMQSACGRKWMRKRTRFCGHDGHEACSRRGGIRGAYGRKVAKCPSGIKPQRKSGERGASLICHFLDCCAKRENNPPCEANRRVRSPWRVTREAGSQSAFTEPPRLLGAIDMRSNKARLKKTTLAIMRWALRERSAGGKQFTKFYC